MNVVLNPSELLYIYKMLLSNPIQDSLKNDQLVEKLQRPIMDCLEREYDRVNENMYKSWENNEQRRIEGLQQSLNDVKVSQEKVVKK